MSISLLDSGPRTSSAPQTDTFDRLRDADRPAEGPSFGRLMADMQQRQAEKAPPADAPQRSRANDPVRPARQEVADTRPRAAPTGNDPRDNRANDRASDRSNDRTSVQPSDRAHERSAASENRQSSPAQDAATNTRDKPSNDREPAAATTATATETAADPTRASASDTPSEDVGVDAQAQAGTRQADGMATGIPDSAGQADGTQQPDNFSLKAVTLGPNLNVITPEKAVPNEQSLEAFARSQGLDEKAVKWLMGGDGQAGRKTTGAGTDDTGGGLSLDGSADGSSGDTANAGAGTSTSDSLRAGLYGSMFIASSAHRPLPAGNGVPPGDLQAAAAAAAAAAGADAGTASDTQGAASLAAGGAAPAAPPSPQNTLISAFAALMQGAPQETGTTTTPSSGIKASTETEGLADLQNSSMRLPPPAAMWMQQIKTATPQAMPSTSTRAPAVSESELDLSADISPDLIDRLSGSPPVPNMSAASHTPPGAPGAAPALPVRNDTPATAAPAAPAQADAAQRSENIQNLATKMGQAVGERILSEIEKGQYHLKLQLRPATLGHIEVEMRMRSGEMDATFTAPQALTRELLQEGMSRLKETMSQMGMNVANFNVGDGQTQQRGGESTPQSSVLAGSKDSAAPGQTETVTATAPRAKASADGLDVLV